MKVSIFAAASIIGLTLAAPASEKRDTIAQCATNLANCDASLAPGDTAGYTACHNTVRFLTILVFPFNIGMNVGTGTNMLKNGYFSMLHASTPTLAGGNALRSGRRSVTPLRSAQLIWVTAMPLLHLVMLPAILLATTLYVS
jgi:hypothetical protein